MAELRRNLLTTSSATFLFNNSSSPYKMGGLPSLSMSMKVLKKGCECGMRHIKLLIRANLISLLAPV